jgi:superfamily II DNA or RNA helicase
VGLTATPERLDGRGLGEHWQRLVIGPSVAWLRQAGYLAPYRLYAPSVLDTSGLRVRGGDYAREEAQALMLRQAIVGDVASTYQRLAHGRQAIGYAVGVEHSRAMAEMFCRWGVPAAHVDGNTPDAERTATVEAFREGRLRMLWNVDVFSEGVDVPGIEAVILARPTASLGLYLQQVGRGLRPGPGKTCIILDHVGNWERHGRPDDPREWSLEGQRRTRKEVEAGLSHVHRCPACQAVSLARETACPECGHVFAPKLRRVAEKAGELSEITAERVALRREQGEARSFEELVILGRRRGYKNPYGWAKFVMMGRQR